MILGALFNRSTGTRMEHAPCCGAAPVVLALAGG